MYMSTSFASSAACDRVILPAATAAIAPRRARGQWPPHRLWGKSPGKNKSVKGFFPWHDPLSSFFYDPITGRAMGFRLFSIDF
jgi:hypothetical protein